MSAREAIFANIRRSLGVTGAEAPRRFEVETRLTNAPAGVVPQRGQGDVETRVATDLTAGGVRCFDGCVGARAVQGLLPAGWLTFT